MLKKFVFITGAMDMLLGALIVFPALKQPTPETFLSSVMIGAFLCFCAATLMWGAVDIPNRGPVIFWQDLVRVLAVCTILFGVSAGLVGAENYGLALIDAIVGPAYLIGTVRVLGISPLRILAGKSV